MPDDDLSSLRKQALAMMSQILPCKYNDQRYLANPFHVDRNRVARGYSTCGEFPAYVVFRLHGSMHPGLNALRPQGQKRNAWVPAGDGLPHPGDLYALCNGPSLDDTVSHVGVWMDYDEDTHVLTTADWGQGSLWDDNAYQGKVSTRTYYPDTGRATGEQLTGTAPRALAGWVDLDVYFAKPAGKP